MFVWYGIERRVSREVRRRLKCGRPRCRPLSGVQSTVLALVCSQSKHARKPPQASSVWKGMLCVALFRAGPQSRSIDASHVRPRPYGREMRALISLREGWEFFMRLV